MINIQPHLDQLEELKKHMDFFIEVLCTKIYFEGCYIMEETRQGTEYIDKFRNPKILPLPMSLNNDITKRIEVLDYLKGEINKYLGIPADRDGKPQNCKFDFFYFKKI